uniref:Uncharacterized protein n=1 Tax=Sphaerodactylus townsendi TaxID=933632 RepID=A0ACB8FBG9_9SAUR
MLGCHKPTERVCRIHGDPHYYTFDKASYHLMGNCTYTLAKRCNMEEIVPYFRIEAKNVFIEDPPHTYVHRVLAHIHASRVEMHKDEPDKVMLDKTWRTLPVSYGSGAVTITKSGRFISLVTNFHLSVSYDTEHLVEIRLPGLFFNRSCGLCGNFNGDAHDDFMMPNGQQAKSSEELASSWKVIDADHGAVCGAPEVEEPCESDQEELYRKDEFCGIMIKSPGPFQACHSTISPESFLYSCLRDMCSFQGNHKQLCKALEVYSDSCQRAGVDIPDWRDDSYCEFLCPPNSEHKMCTTPCPATCSNLLAPTKCDRRCVEGCECHEGFVFSGGECVTLADCGCVVEGKYYEKDETFVQPHCLGRCRCVGNGTLSCTDKEICKEGEICKVQNGVLGCFLPSTRVCHVFAGSQYMTLDGNFYRFQGLCSYRVLESCAKRVEQFFMTIVYARQAATTAAILESVTTSYKDQEVTVRNKKVYVNGVESSTRRTLPLGIMVKEKQPYMILIFPFGLRVKFDGVQHLFIEVDEAFNHNLCGLCASDSMNSMGRRDRDVTRYASSWLVMTEKDWQCDPQLKAPPECSEASKKRPVEKCQRISDRSGPFEACHWKVHPQNYFESCLLEHCDAGRGLLPCGGSVQAYASACENAGIALGRWGNKTLCVLVELPQTPCDFSCSFTTDLCTWTQSTTDDIDWILTKGSTPSWLTGPSSAHTGAEDHYIYINGREALEGEVAHLVSPACTPRGPFCFGFWYHLYGAATLMSLRVYVAPEGKERKLLWIATGRKGDRWLPAKVTVPNTGRLQVIVEGMRGEDFLSDAAVDDFSVTPGPCGG